jgi:type I restriction enzyme S subunit
MVNMGELFANRRIHHTKMDRVPLGPEQTSFLLEDGDLLFARQSLVLEGAGQASLFLGDSEPVTFESHIIRVRLDKLRADPAFFFYFFRSHLGRSSIEKIVIQGAGASGIRASDLPSVLVPAVSLGEQRAIANILGALDDKIELNRQMNETLEALARALFQSWFVDFDPVRAKMRSEQPVGMDAATAGLFPSRLVQTEHGEVPEGWTTRPLGDLVDALSGGTPSKADERLWDGALPWISPKVMLDIHAHDSDDRVSEAAVGNGTRLVPSGTTLVMVRGMGLHEKVRVSQATRDVTFNQDVKALVARDLHPTLLFFGMLAAQTDLLTRVESAGNGTGKLPSDILLARPLTLPPPTEQAALAAHFDRLNKRIIASRAESKTLAATRDLLLPRLLSGELRVPDAERLVAEAV